MNDSISGKGEGMGMYIVGMNFGVIESKWREGLRWGAGDGVVVEEEEDTGEDEEEDASSLT